MILFELTQSEQHTAYQDLEIANGNRQYDFIRSMVIAALALQRTFLSQTIIKALNFHAIACLHTNAGEYRPCLHRRRCRLLIDCGGKDLAPPISREHVAPPLCPRRPRQKLRSARSGAQLGGQEHSWPRRARSRRRSRGRFASGQPPSHGVFDGASQRREWQASWVQ